MGWSEERIALLRKLWAEGLSAHQIAKQLGGVSRNAVIGKVHRLGLAGRSSPSRPAKRPVRTAAPRAPRVYISKPPTKGSYGSAVANARSEYAAAIERSKALEPVRGADGVTLRVMQLNESTCRFPIGDPAQEAFAFCGRGVEGERVYCTDHARLCYQPEAVRESRKKASEKLATFLGRRPRTPSGFKAYAGDY